MQKLGHIGHHVRWEDIKGSASYKAEGIAEQGVVIDKPSKTKMKQRRARGNRLLPLGMGHD